MPWGRQDDEHYLDTDIDKYDIPAAAIGLFWLSISYGNKNLTDGFLPEAAVRRLPGSDRKNISKLLEATWWVKVTGGYQIRRFLKYNKSKEEVLQERAQATARQEEYRRKKQADAVKASGQEALDLTEGSENNAVSNAVTNGQNGVGHTVSHAVTNAPQAGCHTVSNLARIPNPDSRIPGIPIPESESSSPQPPAPQRGKSPPAPSGGVDDDLLSKLLDFGLDRRVAERLAADHPDQCRFQLSWMPERTQSKRTPIDDPCGYLIRAIEGAYPPPAGVKEAQQREAEAAARLAEQRAIRARELALNAAYAAMPEGQREELQDAAREEILAGSVNKLRRDKGKDPIVNDAQIREIVLRLMVDRGLFTEPPVERTAVSGQSP